MSSDVMQKVNQILVGYYHYYGITDNSKALASFRYRVTKSLFCWLNRRSQRKIFALDKFLRVWNVMIRPPRIYVNIWYAQ